MKKITATAFLTKLKEYFWVTIAGILNAMSLYVFINPSHLIAGGFSGLSSVLTYVFELFIPNVGYDKLMSVVYFIINIPLLIVSLVMLRGDFTFKSIWATVVCTAFLALLAYFPDLQFTQSRLIAVILGGIVIGMSMYIASEYNGSNGGTEIIARIVATRHPEVDLSMVILIANVAITVCGSSVVIIIKNESIAIILYSFVYIFLGATVLGMLKRGFNHPQKFMIVTTEYEQIIADITTHFKRGCTCMDVVPKNDSDPPKKIVMVIVQYRQMSRLKQLIKHCDPHAFTFVKDVYDVFSRPTFNRSYKLK